MQEIKRNHSLKGIASEIEKIENWIDKNGLSGWDPYDLKGHKFFITLSKLPVRYLNGIVNHLIDLFPLLLRKVFRVEKTKNSKSIGLLIAAYCNMYEITKKE